MAQADAGASNKTLSPPRCSVVHAWLTVDQVAYLQRAADRRRIHIDQLVALIVVGAIANAAVGDLVD